MSVNTLCVFGTRPETIKMAPVIRVLETNAYFKNRVCVTGQHEKMLHSTLDLFNIKPDYNLHVMVKNQDLCHLTARILQGLPAVFEDCRPDLVLVHGDTTTTMAASLAAYYHRIPVAHVEAGLRTQNIYLPWPEEANRKIAGCLTQLHFAPTETAKHNLLNEGVLEEHIHVTGNTVIDALLDMVKSIENNESLVQSLRQQFHFLTKPQMILITGHRRESFGSGFQRICEALLEIARRFPEVDLVYPVHLNPNVQAPVRSLLSDVPNIHLIEPVDYLPFVYLMQASTLILTDSGGIQEEAPSLGKPVLVMRDLTERPEAIKAGTVLLVGTHVQRIVSQVEKLLRDEKLYARMSMAQNPYGDGKAAARILSVLSTFFTTSKEAVIL